MSEEDAPVFDTSLEASAEMGPPLAPRPDDAKSSGRMPRWLIAAFAIVGGLSLVTLAAGGTYAAVVNNWWPSVTGRVYSEAEHETAVAEAVESGEKEGYASGLEDGKSEGYSLGFSDGEASGYADGEDAGYAHGLDVGSEKGYQDGSRAGYKDGYAAGESAGRVSGYSAGYDTGWTDGCRSLFTGLGTDRIGDWWDYFYNSSWGSYYTRSACS